MMQDFYFYQKIAGTPKIFVSTKLWVVKVTIPYVISCKDNNGNDRNHWKIGQVLN